MCRLFKLAGYGSRLFLLIRHYRINEVFQSFSSTNISAIADLRPQILFVILCYIFRQIISDTFSCKKGETPCSVFRHSVSPRLDFLNNYFWTYSLFCGPFVYNFPQHSTQPVFYFLTERRFFDGEFCFCSLVC